MNSDETAKEEKWSRANVNVLRLKEVFIIQPMLKYICLGHLFTIWKQNRQVESGILETFAETKVKGVVELLVHIGGKLENVTLFQLTVT